MVDKYELISEDMGYPCRRTYRVSVPGGWLYVTTVWDREGNSPAVAQTFIPDPSDPFDMRSDRRSADNQSLAS